MQSESRTPHSAPTWISLAPKLQYLCQIVAGGGLHPDSNNIQSIHDVGDGSLLSTFRFGFGR